MSEPKWMTLARAELGEKEIKGEEDNPAIVGYFRDAGFAGIKDDETAWCAGFVGAQLERSGVASAKSLAARSYMQWGKPVKKPYPGCIAVFSRGNPSGWQGHVAFFLEETDGKVKVLGGNQRNKVGINSYSKARLLGYREPARAGNSRTIRASVGGAVSSGVVAVANNSDSVLSASDQFKFLGEYMPMMSILGGVLAIGCFGMVMWARIDDSNKKGR